MSPPKQTGVIDRINRDNQDGVAMGAAFPKASAAYKALPANSVNQRQRIKMMVLMARSHTKL